MIETQPEQRERGARGGNASHGLEADSLRSDSASVRNLTREESGRSIVAALTSVVPAGTVAASQKSYSQPELEDTYLIALAKQGRADAYNTILKRYHGFVRLKASSYFLIGGDADDLIQEGLVGLYKAIRDYRTDRESSFRNFAELCITRQIITAVKTSTRNKHTPLNEYVSFSQTPASSGGDGDPTLDELLPGPSVHDPVNQVISSEELKSLVACLSSVLSELESSVLSLYLDGYSYEVIGERLDCDTKTVDNALQRVKRKVGSHLDARAVPA